MKKVPPLVINLLKYNREKVYITQGTFHMTLKLYSSKTAIRFTTETKLEHLFGVLRTVLVAPLQEACGGFGRSAQVVCHDDAWISGN